MSDNKENGTTERRKISLQEAIKQKMENKKLQSASGNPMTNMSNTTHKMKSQQTKKPNNQRKRTGV
ncbi:hypothetical protein [Ammoniphilus resinae]|uniref:Uncharacterized protein n=1 Tax=Ammoniphilus resinae TaxID=861532 RepID=A0ABS4GJ45_9BACL|nr:hypothetical protein [Ammoniphilus resinae]MBP1930177.1 hypothetical protein [Ammoniphilus resinae]